MPLRIAFDLDGVLADMDAALVRQAETVFGEQIVRAFEADAASPDGRPETQGDQAAPPDPVDTTPPVARLRMTSRQERTLWRHVATVENFWETLQETEAGIVARLGKMAAERRWEIIFLTKRPRTTGATAQLQSQRWLASKGFPLPSVFVVRGSRGRIAASLDLDVVVDDRPENCLDVTIDSKARPILVWRDDEKTLPAGAKRLGIGVVRSVGDCLEILATLDQHNSQQDPGLLARVKKMLGLKTPAGA
jgi:hypothetical protein